MKKIMIILAATVVCAFGLAVGIVFFVVQEDMPEGAVHTTRPPEVLPRGGEAEAELFLRQFVTMFSVYDGFYDMDSGAFYARTHGYWAYVDELTQPPLYFTGGRFGGEHFESSTWSEEDVIVFDRDGELITDGIFLRTFEYSWSWDGDDEVHTVEYDGSASNFFLFDLDDSDEPVIVVMFLAVGSSHMFSVVYQFIDGEYREVFEGGHLNFFNDNQGNLILRDNGPSHHWWGGGTYYYVTMTDEGMDFASAAHLMAYFPAFPQHDEDYFDDDLLVAIYELRMDELAEEITKNILAYFASLPSTVEIILPPWTVWDGTEASAVAKIEAFVRRLVTVQAFSDYFGVYNQDTETFHAVRWDTPSEFVLPSRSPLFFHSNQMVGSLLTRDGEWRNMPSTILHLHPRDLGQTEWDQRQVWTLWAMDFNIIDFDGNGFPDVLVYYDSPWGDDVGFHRLYRWNKGPFDLDIDLYFEWAQGESDPFEQSAGGVREDLRWQIITRLRAEFDALPPSAVTITLPQ
ncbi:MAG: hypothetical protein FWE06_02275 [Oscillospiraceae bacterium]|nr:hypothetical protein [Oscillospiraceae bacterium]